jgi:hypothetical protein
MALSVHEQLIVDNDYFKKVIGLVPNSFINTELESNDSRFGLAGLLIQMFILTELNLTEGERHVNVCIGFYNVCYTSFCWWFTDSSCSYGTLKVLL